MGLKGEILMDYNAASLALHQQHRGKLGVQSLVNVSNNDDLATAYTPGQL